MADRRQTMRDDEGRPALHELLHRLLNQMLRTGIDRGGSLVEDQDRIVREQCTGDGQKLLLALGNIGRFLIQLHLVAAGQGADKAICAGCLRGGDDLLVGGIEPAVADILHDGALEQPGVLQYHAEGVTQVAAAEGGHRVAVDADFAAVYIVKTHQKLDDGRLAGACRPDDGDHFSWLDLGVEIVDDDLIRLIAELHVVEGHLAFYASDFHRIRHITGLFLFFQEFENTLGCGRHGLEHVGNLRQLGDGLGKALDVLDKRDDIADLDRAGRCQHGAGHRDGDVAQVADEVHDRHHHAGQELAFPGRLVEDMVRFAEGRKLTLLAVEGLDDVVPGEGFLDLAVDLAQVSLLGKEVFLRMLDDDRHDHHRQRNDDEGDQRHERGDRKHHRDHTADGQHGGDELGDRLVERLPEGIDVVRDSGKDVADLVGFKVGQRHPIDLFADVLTHPEAQAL